MNKYPRTEVVAKEIYHAWGVLLEDAQAMEESMQRQIEDLSRKLALKDKQVEGLISDQAHWKRKYIEATPPPIAPVAREETRETDAASVDPGDGMYRDKVSRDFARSLERRLHAAEAERDEAIRIMRGDPAKIHSLTAFVKGFTEAADYLKKEADTARAERDEAISNANYKRVTELRAEVARLKEERDAAIESKEEWKEQAQRDSALACCNETLRTALATATARIEELEKALAAINRRLQGLSGWITSRDSEVDAEETTAVEIINEIDEITILATAGTMLERRRAQQATQGQ